MTNQNDFTVPPLPPRYRFRDLIWGDSMINDDDRVRVEFFTNEKSFKERLQLYFIKNQRSSLRIRTFNLIIKLLTCILYVIRVIMDDPYANCASTVNGNATHWNTVDNVEFQKHPVINWDCILWVHRHQSLWLCQVSVAVVSLLECIVVQYLSYKGNILQQIMSLEFFLELINTVPFIVTIFWAPLRHLFVPVFINIWLAKTSLQDMFNDLHRVMQKSQSARSQQLMILCATLLCLVFISTCGVQHLQRGGNQKLGLMETLWLVIVTFSTVGYGDIYPDIYPSQIFMSVMICAALIVLPTQFEKLAYNYVERQKQGGTYSSHRAQTEKHVVVCVTVLCPDTVMDFLNEFYAHPNLQDFYVVLLSPRDLDPTMKMLLQVPLWAQRVIYIRGSALKDSDLVRCRMQDAEACFILAAQTYADKTAADEHTILRSWAVKDYAPHCPQYVQIFRPENKFHVKFAENVVCEDEFKYALLANNCLFPGTSTLVTLLLHTSRGQEGQSSSEEWQRLYGRCSGNEIYHIRLGDSKFFGEYEGKSFTFASFHAHRKYGVSLLGIQKDIQDSNIQLNPGPRHIMKKSDLCYYMNITKEENSAFILAHPNQDDTKSDRTRLPKGTEQASRVASMIASVVVSSMDRSKRSGTVALELQHTTVANPEMNRTGSKKLRLELPKGLNIQSLQKRPSIAPVPAMLEANDIMIHLDSDENEEDVSVSFNDDNVSWLDGSVDYVRGFPPVMPYIGTSPTLCHLMREKRPLCCLNISKACEHCDFKNANEYNWPNRAIIIAADYASTGLYNFIVPLRSHARPKSTLNPIVILLETTRDLSFLEIICYFPFVYWMIGSINCLDDLLVAGINLADNVVIVNKETSNSAEEDALADCNTIVAVQTIFRLFPNSNIITELSQSSNMRFMQFRAKDMYSYTLSKLEKKERERGSHLSHMFRMPFAAGNVFSASMLDTFLYQAFVKDYLITFFRLLLGLDQAVGSGHLSCMKIKKEDLWIRTYGRLYQKLCATTCEIPMGIYRTQAYSPQHTTASLKGMADHEELLDANIMSPERQEISQMVKCRMARLGLPLDDYYEVSEKKNQISFVIINPSYDLKLEVDDLIYLIRPSSLSPQPSPLIDERKLQQHLKREEPTGAAVSEPTEMMSKHASKETKKRSGGGKIISIKDKDSKIPIIYMDDDSEESAASSSDDENSRPLFGLEELAAQSAGRRSVRGTIV